MYEPFAGNYVWNLSVNICLNMGGVMGEIDPANNVLRTLAGDLPPFPMQEPEWNFRYITGIEPDDGHH